MIKHFFWICGLLFLLGCNNEPDAVPTLQATAVLPIDRNTSDTSANIPQSSNQLPRIGDAYFVQGQLPDSGRVTYIITSTAGSLVDVNISNPSIEVTLIGVNDNQEVGQTVNGRWIGTLPTEQAYYVHLNSIFFGLNYQLNISTLNQITSLPATIEEELSLAGQDSYIFTANAGQTISITFDGEGFFGLAGEDGTIVIDRAEETQNWSGTVPTGQQYTLYLIGDDRAPYTLTIE